MVNPGMAYQLKVAGMKCCLWCTRNEPGNTIEHHSRQEEPSSDIKLQHQNNDQFVIMIAHLDMTGLHEYVILEGALCGVEALDLHAMRTVR